MDNGHKNTPKVLTTNDIRKRAQDWTLAGDVGLLAHIEQFSENLVSKSQETQKNFNELVDDFENLYTKVGNITNQFLALQNCQFVENRVYDEETPTEEKKEVQVQNAGEQEKISLMQYKEAVEIGVKLLDTHFQEVQLPPNSDSDDDDDDDGDDEEVSTENSVIWKPKNPYVTKRFPLLIGSAEWWADDQVGLGTNEDNLDSDKIISESESDMESLKSVEKTIKSSSSSSLENVKSTSTKPVFLESSSEDLFGFDKNENFKSHSTKGSTSLLAEPASFPVDLETETKKIDSSSENRPPVDKSGREETAAAAKPKMVDSAFTRELMAKLVSVTNKNETGSKEKEKAKEEIAERRKPEESLFDETDDTSDLFLTKIKKIPEKTAGGDGLFFSAKMDDDLIKGENDLFSGGDLFESDVLKKSESPILKKTIPAVEKKEAIEPKKNLTNDLFNDLDDDDTLFAAKPMNLGKPEKSLPSAEQDVSNTSKTVPAPEMCWDVEEGLFDNIKTDFDDDLFKSSGLFDTKVTKAAEPKKFETESKNTKGLFAKESAKPTAKTEKSVFDSNISKDPFQDPFGFSSSSELTDKKLSILDSDEEDLFSKSFKEESKPVIKAMPLPVDDDAALFEEKPNPADSVSMSSSWSSLFDDVGAFKSRLASVFEKDKNRDEDLFGGTEDSFFSGEEKLAKESKHIEKSSLFDECNDGDDLFSEEVAKPVQLRVKGTIEDLEDDLFKTSETKREMSEPKKEDILDGLFSDLKSDAGKPKPPRTLSLKTKETKPVGKLNIPDNLKVKFESVAKHISPGVKPPKEEKEEKEEKKDEVLDVEPQPSALLKCPSKDRVKIPRRRRPQSRRARQEAIRNSGTWEEPIHQSPEGSLQSPIPSNPLSPSTDEEDFFKVPELDTNFEKEDQSIFKCDLFESKSSKLEESLLFDGAPVLSPVSPKNTELPATTPETEALFGSPKSKPSTLFDDDFEGDENLFKGTTTTTTTTITTTSTTTSTKTTTKPSSTLFLGEEKLKNSLFDLDDEEDDLFGGARSSHLSASKPPPVEKPKQVKDTKEKENSSFVDPLGLMTND